MESPVPLIILVVVGVLLAAIFSGLAAKRRRDALRAWATARGLRFEPGRARIEGAFPEFQCLRQGSNRYAYNRMTGDWQGRRFTGFDYHWETHSTDSKGRRQTHHHHFSAVILGSDVPLEPLSIRPESFLDKITEFFGFDDIDFESAEFSRRFHVKAPDRKWAFDVLHPRAMEFLLTQPQFSIQFGRDCVIAHRSSRFRPEGFEEAAGVVQGLLDRLPEYLIQQQRERSHA